MVTAKGFGAKGFGMVLCAALLCDGMSAAWAQVAPAAKAQTSQSKTQKKNAGAKFGLSNPNAPISVAADRLDADQTKHTLIYSGHAVVQQGDVYLHTDRLEVVAPDGKTPDKIYASGHVILTASSGTATGSDGVYDVNPRIITLTGHVVLTRGENVMRGSKLTINLISGVAHLTGVSDKQDQPGRIQGMFTPRDLSKTKSGAKPGTDKQ